MSARSQTYPLVGFGEDGVVTDIAPERLKPSQLAAAENMILPDGVVTERGGWAGIGVNDPLVSGLVSFLLQSVLMVPNIDTGVAEIVVTGTDVAGVADPAYGKATTGDAGQAATLGVFGPAWARAYYRGEALICPRSGTDQILRWAFLKGSQIPSNPGTGTYSVADGSNQLVGAASNFDPQLPVGAYVGGGVSRDPLHRVVAVTSDTKAGIASKADWDVPSQDVVIYADGAIGLKVLVTDIGLATHTASSVTVTGNGTKWAQAGPGFGVVQGGDYILRVGDDIANAMRVSAVVGDTSLTVIANTVGAFTDQPYVILRPACGKEACEHDNALWVAGVDWAKSTVFTTPAGYELAHVTNGRFGKTIQADEAMRMFEVPVPSPEAAGEIMALRSTPWGLAVGKSDALWVITGQYPALDVRMIAALGTIDQRAMIAVDDVLIFAGHEGFFSWQGGRPRDLTEGRRAEWVERAKSMSRCVLGSVRNHLYISFEADTGAECWVYDLSRGVHLGNFTSDDAANTVLDPATSIPITTGIESAVYMDSARIPGEEDRLLFVVPNPNRLQVQDVSTTITGPDEDNAVPATNIAPLEVWTGTNLAGPPSRRARVVGAKLTYLCSGTAPGVLDMVTRVDGAAEAAEDSFAATTGAVAATARVWPNAGGVGVACRSFQIGLRRTGGTSVKRVSIREVEVVVRQVRPRA